MHNFFKKIVILHEIFKEDSCGNDLVSHWFLQLLLVRKVCKFHISS